MSTDPPVIQFDTVGLRYGTGPEVLQDVSFTLHAGTMHFLTGASGAGKSSLLRLMYMGVRPSRGLISLFDRDITTVTRSESIALRRRIGIVFQDFRLLAHLSAFDNVALPLRLAGVPEKQIRGDVCELLQWVGLGEKLDTLPTRLSGGEQQRIAIARAVIARPGLLVADEPTGNVDESIARRLIRLFEELNGFGTTVVIATHNRNLIAQFDHPRLELADGSVTAVPSPTNSREQGPV